MHQEYNLEGEKLIERIWFEDEASQILRDYGFTEAPKGLIGFNIRGNRVIVSTRGQTTEMKAGKFLLRAGFGDDASRAFSEAISAQSALMAGAELSITQCGVEAQDVYENGPHSCMSGMDAVGAYDSVDVAVAYVEIEDRIVARTVINIHEKEYVHIYGNSSILKPLLIEAGYKRGDLEGCTIDNIVDGNGMSLCPYLDSVGSVDTMGDRLLITRNGEYHAQRVDGYLGEVYLCDSCAETVDEDDCCWDEYNEVYLCAYCFEEAHVNLNDRWFNKNDTDSVVQYRNGDWGLVEESIYSEFDNEYYDEADVTWVERIECYYPNGEVCEAVCDPDERDDDGLRALDYCVKFEGEWVCEDYIDEYKELMAEEEEAA
jgi:hypothetical protein